jgi:predicted  nucleic acid-binding Zn-ribbon protein
MALKLTKKELAERTKLCDDVRSAADVLEEALTDFQDAVQTAYDALQDKVTAYNETLAPLREFKDDISSRLEEEISDKSERWQESDKGQAASEWQQEWANADIEDIELDGVPTLDLRIDSPADEIEQLSDELSE